MSNRLNSDDLILLKLQAAQKISKILGKQGDLHGHYSVLGEEQIAESINDDLAKANRRNKGIQQEMLDIKVSRKQAGEIVNLLRENGISISELQPNGTTDLILIDVVANREAFANIDETKQVRNTDIRINTVTKLIIQSTDNHDFAIKPVVDEKGQRKLEITLRDKSNRFDLLANKAASVQRALMDNKILTEAVPNQEEGVVHISIPLHEQNEGALRDLELKQAQEAIQESEQRASAQVIPLRDNGQQRP